MDSWNGARCVRGNYDILLKWIKIEPALSTYLPLTPNDFKARDPVYLSILITVCRVREVAPASPTPPRHRAVGRGLHHHHRIAPFHTDRPRGFPDTGLHNNSLLQHWHTSHWILYYSASAKLCDSGHCAMQLRGACWGLMNPLLGSTLHPL